MSYNEESLELHSHDGPVTPGGSFEEVELEAETVYMRLHKSTLPRLYNQDIIPTDVALGRYMVRVSAQRRAHLDVQKLARHSRSMTLDDDVADGLDLVSAHFPTEAWGFNLDEITWACTMTKESKTSKASRLLVRQSQLTRNPLSAWGVPSCAFYPQVADAGEDLTSLPTDLGIEHDFGEDDAEEVAGAGKRRHKKNSELVTINQQRMRRLRRISITTRILPLHWLPLFLAKQSTIMLKINNPIIICFTLQERLRRQLPFHQDDPVYLASLIQFQKNLYFVSHHVIVRASLTDELSERLVAADGHLHRMEQSMARMEEREKTFSNLLDGYAETLATDVSKAPLMRRRRNQVRAKAARDTKQANINPDKIEPDLEKVMQVALSFERSKTSKEKVIADQALASDEEEEEEAAEVTAPAPPPRSFGKKKRPEITLDLSDEEEIVEAVRVTKRAREEEAEEKPAKRPKLEVPMKIVKALPSPTLPVLDLSDDM